MNFNFNQKLIIPGVIGIVLLVIVLAGVLYYSSQQNKTDPNTPPSSQQATDEENRKIIEEVSKLMDLPTDEVPTVATVTDITKLQDQPFFQRAKNGDKVLIYSNARRAILYDPLIKKVIDVAPLNISSPSAQIATPSATPSKTP